MKKMIFALACVASFHVAWGQIPLTTLPSGGNKKAAVTEQIGLTTVTIHYDRPGVKGREGKIWGELIPVGFTDPGFGSSHAAPWRAGANENTTIEFTNDVQVEGQALPAGRYGFFIAWDPAECTLIFSKNSTSWGHFYYDPKEDVLRVKVKPQTLANSVEWLKYEFTNQTENSATVSLQWEKMAIPFTITTDYIRDQLASFHRELRSERGFIWQSWDQAAQWCVQHNTNLEEALLWTDSASSANFGGDRSFQAFSTRSQVLTKLGRADEAKAVMQKALPFGTMFEVHQYARALIGMNMKQEALETFKKNLEKYPGQFTTILGMARGYSAVGDYKTALKYATQAQPLATDQQNKNNVASIIEKLKAGKDIN